jgi:predicted nucleotidyltransferase component of viral defense system
MLKDIQILLEKLKNDEIFKAFYLCGGTAISYYLNHRMSYDLDFVGEEKLNVDLLKTLIIKYDAKFIPDPDASVFRINTGEELENYKMTFNIDNIKVEFFYPNDKVSEEIVLKYRSKSNNILGNIKILPIEGIAALKILALFKRHKIRDLFDVYVLLKENVINTDKLEQYYSLEYRQMTIVEFIEDFEDDGTESLDFDENNTFYNEFKNLTHNQKINILKDRLLEIIIKSVLNEY